MRIDRLVKRKDKALTISPGATVTNVARVMRDNNVGCLVVLDGGGEIVGILTERDIVTKVVASSACGNEVTAEQIMTREVITCPKGTSIAAAQEMMGQHNIRHLPIMDDGVLVGVISIRDVLAHQLATVERTVRRQSALLDDLEKVYPGITQLERDPGGRIVL